MIIRLPKPRKKKSAKELKRDYIKRNMGRKTSNGSIICGITFIPKKKGGK